jgi:hypothetical protein
VTPEYKNDDFFGGIVGFTIADDIPNASTTYPVRTPPDASSTFPALSDRERQMADPSGGFQAHEGKGIVILGTPYPTDQSLTAPMPGFGADSGVEPVQVMMSESSEGTPNGKPPQNREPDITAGMELNPEKASVFRGGADFTVKPNEVKIDKVTGLVKPTHGVSLDVNPATLEKWGPQQIQSIPSELKIIQRGKRLEHFEIVPKEPMTLERFQELLNKIKLYN